MNRLADVLESITEQQGAITREQALEIGARMGW